MIDEDGNPIPGGVAFKNAGKGFALATGEARFTPQQRRFLEEFFVDQDERAAALRAGYASGSAGWHLTQQPHISDAIAEYRAKLIKRSVVTAERVLAEFANIAFGDPRSIFTWKDGRLTLIDSDKLTPEQVSMVAGIKIGKLDGLEVKLNDKMTALKQLGNHLGLFVQKHEISGPGGSPIEYNDMTTDERRKRIDELLAMRRIEPESVTITPVIEDDLPEFVWDDPAWEI